MRERDIDDHADLSFVLEYEGKSVKMHLCDSNILALRLTTDPLLYKLKQSIEALYAELKKKVGVENNAQRR